MTSSSRNFSIDDAFEIGMQENDDAHDVTSPARFGALNFDRKSNPVLAGGRGNCETRTELDESKLKYQNLENDEDGLHGNGNTPNSINGVFKIPDAGRGSTRSSRWSFSTISNTTQLSYRECFSWTRHPLIQKNRRVVLSSFLLVFIGLALIFTGVGLQVNPTAGVSSAIFFIPGFLLLIPGVYHVIFIYCAVRGRKGFRFFYLPYFEK